MYMTNTTDNHAMGCFNSELIHGVLSTFIFLKNCDYFSVLNF